MRMFQGLGFSLRVHAADKILRNNDASSLMRRSSCRALLIIGLALAVLSGKVYAQFDSPLPEHDSYEIPADDQGILGDTVDIDTGALSFYTVDVSLPGNSDLPVQFGRRLSDRFAYKYGALGNWRFDVPQIIGVGSSPSANCEDPWRLTVDKYYDINIEEGEPGAAEYIRNVQSHSVSILDSNSSSQPYYLISSGLVYITSNSQSLTGLPLSPNPFPSHARYATESGWILYCDNSNPNYTIAVAPNGTKYHFNVDGKRYAFNEAPSGGNWTRAVYASRVEDVHGNWVEYDYTVGTGIDALTRVTRIHSNDGREITVGYNAQGLVSTVTANSRVWQYEYTEVLSNPNFPPTPTSSRHMALSKVTLPDGTYWTIGAAHTLARTDLLEDCRYLEDLAITHPNGVTGTFKFKHLVNGKVNVNAPTIGPLTYGVIMCGDGQYDDEYSELLDQRVSLSVATTEKKLSGLGMADAVWTYDYEEDLGAYKGAQGALSNSKKRTVTDPNGNIEISYVNRRVSLYTGVVERIESYNAGSASPIRVVENEYDIGVRFGNSASRLTGYTSSREGRFFYLDKTITTQGADVFTTEYTYDEDLASPTFSFGRPVSQTTYSNLSPESRVTNTTYEHNKTKWILGLPDTVTRNNKLFDDYTYDSLGRVTRHDRFGALYKTFGYHGLGTQGGALAWEEDALLRRTSFDNYKRGTPQLITRADTTTVSRVVDNNGWVTSATNARGVTTAFEYNDVGWRTKIDRPAPWSDTIIAYTNPGAGLVQSATRGSARTTITHDALLRPILTKSEPLSGGGLTTYVKTDYDGLGRVTFTSQPSTLSNPTAGVDTTYDALGRMTQTRETVAPNATTAYAYLSGNRTRVTDPRSFATTTTLRAYGTPDNGDVIKIEQPEGVTTDMTYDDWGNMLTATQGGGGVSLTQNYVYDSRLRLCRHSVPETGDTLYEYDIADQQIGLARGQAFGTTCVAPPSASKIVRAYDDLGRVDAVTYPGSTPGYAITFDANGNVERNARGGVVWDYVYNTADQLEEEKLTIDGRVYTTTYLFDGDGDLVSQTTPAGRIVSFAPNGLGQSTRAQVSGYNYASSISYHTDGSLAGLTYGNGHVLTRGLNARQLVDTIKVQKTGVTAVDLTYNYLPDGRISEKIDRATPLTFGAARTVEAQYDASGRLWRARDTAVGGAWNNYAYDNRGNVSDNGRLTFTYDAAEQPTSMGGAASGSYVYDGNLKRAKQTINGETIYSVYAQSGAILYRDNVTTGVATDYIRAAGKTIARLKGSVTVFPHQDHLGSPIAETGLSGAVNWHEGYAAYGEKRLDPTGNRDDEGFTGHIDDAATGLTYMQARYYDAVIGRFLSNDPVAFSAARPEYFNRYAYAGNDPTNGLDPDGRDFFLIFAPPTIPVDKQIEVNKQTAVVTAGAAAAAASLAVPDPTDLVVAGAAAKFGGSLLKGNKAANEIKTITIDSSKSPQAAQHLKDAGVDGKILTVDRAGAAGRRSEALKGTPTKPGLDRDEAPPAVFKEGGAGSSVRHIDASDNRSAGAQLGNQLKRVPDGECVKIKCD